MMVPMVEYSRGINSSNFILTVEKDYKAEQDSIEMFRYNEIPYFLKMHTQEKDRKRQFCYDITSRRSLEQLLEYKLLDDQLLINILSSFDQACMQVENYMLTEDDILLKPELIFLESESELTLYCYLPGNQEDICQQFQEFMEYLLQHLDHKNEQAVQLAYEVYQRATEEKAALHTILKDLRKEDFRKKDIRKKDLETAHSKNLLQNMDSVQEVSKQPVQEVLKQPVQAASKQPVEVRKKQEKPQDAPVKRTGKQREEVTKLKQKETAKKQAGEKLKNLLRKKLYTNGYKNTEEEPIFEEDTEEMSVINPTICMAAETEGIQNQFIYQGMDRTRDFHCMEGKMILGSSNEECDICIPLPMISRVHARIEINEQGTFLEDMNSTNGTQINGELLKYREKYMLKKGDMISLAGENYSFH